MTLHIGGFGGGVVLAGGADQLRIDELGAADALEIGPRGALVCSSDLSDYVTLQGDNHTDAIALHHLFEVTGMNFSYLGAIGEALDTVPANRYYLWLCAKHGAASPVGPSAIIDPHAVLVTPQAEGCVVTDAAWPGIIELNAGGGLPGNQFSNVHFVCLGAREGHPPTSVTAQCFGLWAILFNPTTSFFESIDQIKLYDALGTGAWGELPIGGGAAGTQAIQLWFRGIVSYNNFLFGYGFDSADVTNGNGPARVMFSNLGNPLKWGNDNQGAVGTDRKFTDSDAIVIGDPGEIIRGAIKIFGKLFFGTSRGLHFIAGYGRDSFITDGATPVMRAYNVVGPNAMIEGPDKKLYAVGDQGLWSFDGAGLPEALFTKGRDYTGRSPGYWDLLWTDATQNDNYPGRTNMDLVWMAVDWDRQQVLVGIPFCDATNGFGKGTDTVVIKYHVLTGGFTRQVFAGVAYTAAGYFRAQGQTSGTSFFGTATNSIKTVRRYGYKATNNATPALPSPLPSVSFGPYAPYGPDGQGPLRRLYLVLAWDAAGSLPIVFALTYKIDGSTVDTPTLTIGASAPGAPADGDLWLDTSQTDTNLGNATAGSITPATGGYLLKRYRASVTGWTQIYGLGMQGQRATIPLPVTRRRGTRIVLKVACTTAGARFQFEGLGLNPGDGVEAG